MLNLDMLDAISFSKGCYVGQEIVARTQNLGRIKRRMYGFSADPTLQVHPGDKLFLDGREAGEIVDSVTSSDETNLLAVTRIEQSQEAFYLDADITTRPVKQRALPDAVPPTTTTSLKSCGNSSNNASEVQHLAGSVEQPEADRLVLGVVRRDVLREEDELRALHEVPLRGRVLPAHDLEQRDDLERRADIITSVIEELAEGSDLCRFAQHV